MEKPDPGKKLLLGLALIGAVFALFALVYPYISLEYLETQRAALVAWHGEQPALVVGLYVLTVTVCIGAALPTTGVLALLGGALFGIPVGLLAFCIAATVGSTIVFLWSRHLFREWIESRFHTQLEIINRGVNSEGGYYLFSIRLVMVFPFFLVNLLCGLTSLKIKTYMLATFLSQTIVAAVWVYAGATIAELDAPTDILSLELFVNLSLIGLAPLAGHRLLLWIRGNSKKDIPVRGTSEY